MFGQFKNASDKVSPESKIEFKSMDAFKNNHERIENLDNPKIILYN